jgi:hypothetical protein
MLNMYVTAISLGWMTFDDVPDHWKEKVAAELGMDYPPNE